MNLSNSDIKTLINDDLGSKLIDIRQWQRYIEKEIGFVLPDEQLQWLVNAIEHTAMKNELSLLELWNEVQINSQLHQQLLDAVTIPESRFFRHKPSIQFITALAVQHHNQQHNIETEARCVNESNDTPFRIWSVGCATGQEVWSLAMSLTAENIADYVILGTDVSQKSLAQARAGRYVQRQLCFIPEAYHEFMQPIYEQSPKQTMLRAVSHLNPFLADKPIFNKVLTEWQIVPRLHNQVSFVWHNVFTQEPATEHLQQIIICQNVLIYFRQFDQRDILTRLTAQCALGGHIILAPGEALSWRPSNMRRVIHSQVNAWQKISA